MQTCYPPRLLRLCWGHDFEEDSLAGVHWSGLTPPALIYHHLHVPETMPVVQIAGSRLTLAIDGEGKVKHESHQTHNMTVCCAVQVLNGMRSGTVLGLECQKLSRTWPQVLTLANKNGQSICLGKLLHSAGVTRRSPGA